MEVWAGDSDPDDEWEESSCTPRECTGGHIHADLWTHQTQRYGQG